MKKLMISFFMSILLFAVIGIGSASASYTALEKDESLSTHAKGNDNGHPPSVLPPQC